MGRCGPVDPGGYLAGPEPDHLPMDLASISPRPPAYAAMLGIPWFILLSSARVRMGGSGALPIVKLIDLLVPLPVFAGLGVGALVLWDHGGQGGTIAGAVIGAVFVKVLLV